MLARDSSFVRAKPQLAYAYEKAHLRLLNYKAWIIPKLYDKFYRFEKRLYGLGISPSDYANDTIALLEAWAKVKHLESIPVHTFLSDFALTVYNRVQDRQYVRVVDCDEERAALALYGELMLARHYIESYVRCQPVTMKQAYVDLKELLPLDWVEEAKNGHRPVQQAIDILAQEYNVHAPASYKDIARCYNDRL